MKVNPRNLRYEFVYEFELHARELSDEHFRYLQNRLTLKHRKLEKHQRKTKNRAGIRWWAKFLTLEQEMLFLQRLIEACSEARDHRVQAEYNNSNTFSCGTEDNPHCSHYPSDKCCYCHRIDWEEVYS